MSEFGAAATLSVEVPDSELRAARAQIEDELGDISVSVDAGGPDLGGGGGGGVPALADGGTTMSSMMAAQTELLEDIEDHLAEGMEGGGGVGGGGLLAGAGLAGGGGGIALAAGLAGTAALGPMAVPGSRVDDGGDVGGSARPISERAYEFGREQNIPDLTEVDWSSVGADMATAFVSSVEPTGLGSTLGGAAVATLSTWDASALGAEVDNLLSWQPSLPNPQLDIPSPPSWVTGLLGFGGSGGGGGYESPIPTSSGAQSGPSPGPTDLPAGGIRLPRNGGTRGFRTRESARAELTRRDQGGNRARERGGGGSVTVNQDVTLAPSDLRELDRQMDRFKEDVKRELIRELGLNDLGGVFR